MGELHTPEPWECPDESFRGDYYVIEPKSGFCLATVHRVLEADDEGATIEAPSKANARRIVACVNALAGVSIELLEEMPTNTQWQAFLEGLSGKELSPWPGRLAP